ncbi:hypothetical protein DFH07DRAFT_945270 [Mycena maculata]|uniref:Uncharacterized protein n=1 Tax=Mycena maculata TaxID=230809 RepID=A0AAD7HZL8_9AGAR|nr:hypothetical protein DFH07DRAFT_945270 [Mycena maculata]
MDARPFHENRVRGHPRENLPRHRIQRRYRLSTSLRTNSPTRPPPSTSCAATPSRVKPRARSEEATGNKNIHVRAIDLGSVASVREFASTWETPVPIHVLVNNAGVVTSKYLKTHDGHEINFLIHALVPHVLSLGLLPMLADQARIVNVVSYAHYNSTVALGHGRPKYAYDARQAQQRRRGDPTLAHTMALLTLQGHADDARPRVAAPPDREPLVRTEEDRRAQLPTREQRSVTRDHGTKKIRKTLERIAGIFAITPEQGAVTPYFLASSEAAKGVYDFGYCDRRVKRVPGQPVLNEPLCAAMWDACIPDEDSETLA